MTSDSEAISNERWAKIQRIFDEAMELPIGERTAYVSENCEGDDGLRSQIEALMLAADSEEDLVSELVRSASHKLVDEQTRLRQPIGPFKLVEAIGEGGMGVVYLARRDDHEFEQNVAIKVLHKRITNDETQRRFLAERQILADLSHPNIARLLDGGHTDDGLPYIVMEYIDGKPLVEYCDDNMLSIAQRLALFQQVCHAVAEAHRSLIVHRDIKSNNILVGADGTPKLLDFGIAKVLGKHLGDIDLAKTQLHDRLLTPDSASPEQISGKAITTATDIYSLGILLYELLSACRPFRLSNSTAGEMEQTICEELPLPPSKALHEILEASGGALEQAALDRSSSPGRLQSQLKGELDSIVLMALKKEPRRRYASANAFADDITRYLRGEPIRAVRDSRSYRAWKFITRNRIPVAVASAFMLAVTAFGIINYVQSKEISAQAADLAAQAHALATQNENMEDTLSFLGNVFIAASPEGLQIKEPSALDVLNFAEQKIEEELAGRPEIMGRLLQTFASAFEGQGESARALRNYEAAMDLIADAYGENHPITAAVLHDLGRYHWTRDWALAADYYQRAYAILEQPESVHYFANNPDRRGFALQRLLRDTAELEMAQGEFEAAREHATTALDLAQELSTSMQTSTEIARNLAMLGALNLRLGELQTSDSYFAQALSEFKQSHGENHTYVAQLSNDLALTKHAQGDAVAAERFYLDGVRIYEAVLNDTHPMLLSAKADLGRFYGTEQQPEKAKRLLEEAIAGFRRQQDNPTYTLAFNLVQLAIVESKLKRYDRAETLLDEALAIYEVTIEDTHTFVAGAYRQYGNLRINQGRFTDAITMFDRALAILLQSLGDKHWLTAATQSEKAEALLQLEQHGQARALLESSASVLEGLLGADHRITQYAQDRLARAVEPSSE